MEVLITGLNSNARFVNLFKIKWCNTYLFLFKIKLKIEPIIIYCQVSTDRLLIRTKNWSVQCISILRHRYYTVLGDPVKKALEFATELITLL